MNNMRRTAARILKMLGEAAVSAPTIRRRTTLAFVRDMRKKTPPPKNR
jgi:hypothetical protein